jgi:hypothetical protein
MLRHDRLAAQIALTVAMMLSASSAHAQYMYPAGYGGWGGWGGASTVGGSVATGMGNFAAGAGAYNAETAQARAVNANTAMQMNEYLWQSQQVRNVNYYNQLSSRQAKANKAAKDIYQRLRDNPEPRDVHTGDALNVVLDDLTNPKVYVQAVQGTTDAIDSGLVKNIQFQHAASAVAISLEELSARGVPDTLQTSPQLENERNALKAVVAKAREESHSSGSIKPETLSRARAAIKALQARVAQVVPDGTKDRRECDNFLKALYGLTKMLEMPQIDLFLKGLDQYPTTTVGRLITFMHSFNLRFGVAQTPIQEAAYDQLYPRLVALRDSLYKGGSAPPTPFAAAQPNPAQAKQFFSGMEYDHFGPQPDPHKRPVPTPPPARNQE